MKCPDPMADWEGYWLWCEMHPCSTCDGTGEIYDEQTCGTCDGIGIDPNASDAEDPCDTCPLYTRECIEAGKTPPCKHNSHAKDEAERNATDFYDDYV